MITRPTKRRQINVFWVGSVCHGPPWANSHCTPFPSTQHSKLSLSPFPREVFPDTTKAQMNSKRDHIVLNISVILASGQNHFKASQENGSVQFSIHFLPRHPVLWSDIMEVAYTGILNVKLALVDRGQPDALRRLQGCVTDLFLKDEQVLKVLPGVELKSLCRRPLPIRVKLVLWGLKGCLILFLPESPLMFSDNYPKSSKPFFFF